MQQKLTPTLLTVKQFANKHPAFTQGSLRWMIFKAGSPTTLNTYEQDTALNAVIVRIGRRVLIDEEKFFLWAGASSHGS